MNNKEMHIEQLVDYHFERLVKSSKNTINSTVALTGEQILAVDRNSKDNRANFAKFYLRMKKKYAFKLDYPEDFIQHFAMLFYVALVKIDDIESLDELLADEKLYNTRMAYVRKYIEMNIIFEVNPNAKRVNVGEDQDGKNIHKIINLEGNDSINELVVNENDSTELANLLSDDNQLFKYGADATHTHFIQFFLNNKEELLTKNQLEKYDMLKDIYTPLTDGSLAAKEERNHLLKQVGLSRSDFNTLKSNIKKRVVKKYEAEYGESKSKYGFNSNNRKTIREIFQGYIDEANDPEKYSNAEERQIGMNQYVGRYYDSNEEFELVVTANLSLDEKKQVVRAVNNKDLLSHRLIRVIKQNIEEHLEAFKDMDIKPAQQEFDGYSERTFSDIKTNNVRYFNLNTQGMLLAQKNEREKEIEMIQEARRKYRDFAQCSEVFVYCLECYKKGEHVKKITLNKRDEDGKLIKLCLKCDEERLIEYGITETM